MNPTKKYLFALSIIALTSVQQSQAMELKPSANKAIYEQLKDPAKLATMFFFCPTLGYYFFHYPEDRRSKAPFENVLKGKEWFNVIGNIFNWDNVTNFTDIIPGQRHKVFPWTIKASELPSEKYLTFTTSDTPDIRGFGVFYFCEKNMNKICKYIAATATMYALLYGNLQTTGRDLLEAIFDAYKKVPVNVS